MFFLTPRHVKQGSQFVKDARKLLCYKRDIWNAEVVENVERHIKRLEETVASRDKQQITDAAQSLDTLLGKHLPVQKDAALRENVEVFLVAIAVALGVRTFFLQPFTIPTGSMQPTLNGIIGTPSNEPPPNLLVRFFQGALWGRSYVNKTALANEQIQDMREIKSLLPFVERTPFINFGFFTRTELITDHGNHYIIKEGLDSVKRDFLYPHGSYKYQAGEPIVRGYFDSGDMVFVDKISFHFRKPSRDEVFVFNTQGIPTRENQSQSMVGPSQYYIKRLAGTPGDELRIAPPQLFLNGELAKGRGFERVMSGTLENPKDGYQGYSNASLQQGGLYAMNYLNKPDATVKLESRQYYALGDNSYHSSDSRDWGTVPEQNIMGRGVFVYWPFSRHWGLIR